jgi:hypothetical protein
LLLVPRTRLTATQLRNLAQEIDEIPPDTYATSADLIAAARVSIVAFNESCAINDELSAAEVAIIHERSVIAVAHQLGEEQAEYDWADIESDWPSGVRWAVEDVSEIPDAPAGADAGLWEVEFRRSYDRQVRAIVARYERD